MDVDRRTAGQAAWRSIVGPTPRLGPDDRSGAAIFLSRIQRALDQGGWRRGERVRLHKMKRTWTARAEGRDERYRQYGNRPKDSRVIIITDIERKSHESRQTKRSGDRISTDQTQSGDTVDAESVGSDQTGIADDDPRVRAASKKNWGWGR